MDTSTKVVLACFIGAAMGALLAIEQALFHPIIGVLAGGLAGYLSYEPKKALLAIPLAYRAVAGWKPNKEYWKTFAVRMLGIVWPLLYASSLLSLPEVFNPKDGEFRLGYFAQVFGIIFLVLFFFATMFLMPITSAPKTLREERETSREMYQASHPKRLPGYFLALLKKLPGFLAWVASFLWAFFKLIHSDLRLLCGTDAAIGATIGFFSGSVLIGALSGALIGLLNYELVSKRWLRLVPSST